MKRHLVTGGIALFAAAGFAAVVPAGMMLSGWSLGVHGYAAVFLTVFFSFVVAGALMFLIFYSARHGYDDQAHESVPRGRHDDAEEH